MKFENPYPLPGNYNKTTHGRLTTDLPQAIYSRLKSFTFRKGQLQTTINLFVAKLIPTLEKHKIYDFSNADEYEDFIANMSIIDGRTGSTTQRTLSEDVARNDRGGTKGKGTRDTSAPSKQSDVSSSTNSRRSGSGKKTN
jgi:hypothetical protein